MHRAARTKGDSTRKLIRASAATGLNKSSAAKVGTVVWTEQELKLLGAAVFTKVKEMEAENAKLKAQLQAYQKRDAQAAAVDAATAYENKANQMNPAAKLFWTSRGWNRAPWTWSEFENSYLSSAHEWPGGETFPPPPRAASLSLDDPPPTVATRAPHRRSTISNSCG